MQQVSIYTSLVNTKKYSHTLLVWDHHPLTSVFTDHYMITTTQIGLPNEENPKIRHAFVPSIDMTLTD